LDVKALYALFFFPICATYIARLIPPPGLVALIISRNKCYKAYVVFSSLLLLSLRPKYFSQHRILQQSIYIVPLLWKTKFHSYKKTYRIILLYILVVTFLGGNGPCMLYSENVVRFVWIHYYT
jgi:hypothetical protein